MYKTITTFGAESIILGEKKQKILDKALTFDEEKKCKKFNKIDIFLLQLTCLSLNFIC